MLRISKLTDYAIVLLTYLARADGRDGEMLTARTLADLSKLPVPTVGKIMKALCRAGIVISHRGVKGGYSLQRPAAEVSIASVITAIDGPLALTECAATAPGLCDIEDSCPVRSNWQRINDVVRGALEQVSVLDIGSEHCPADNLIRLNARR